MNSVDTRILPFASKPSYRITIITILIVVVQIIVSVMTYPLLPDNVPSHWNLMGQVDGYDSKFFIAVLWPLVSVVTSGILFVLMPIGSRPEMQRLKKTQAVAQLLALTIILFLLVAQVTTTAIALGFHIDIISVMNIAVSLLFIFTGNYLGKLRRNFWVGIKTPWTIASDVVWERTHRLASWLYVGVGLLGIGVNLIPFTHQWGVIVLVVLASIVSVLYSYVVYMKIGNVGM